MTGDDAFDNTHERERLQKTASDARDLGFICILSTEFLMEQRMRKS